MSRKNLIIILTLILMSICFIVGFNIVKSNEVNSQLDIAKNDSLTFLKLLLKNLGFGLLILIGSFTFYILPVIYIGFNSFHLGLSFHVLLNYVGLKMTFLYLAPHGFIELYWIFYAVVLSDNIFIFFKLIFINNQIVDYELIEKSKKKILRMLFSLVILIFTSCFIEFYFSYTLINNL